MLTATLFVITLTGCTLAAGSQAGKHPPSSPSRKASPTSDCLRPPCSATLPKDFAPVLVDVPPKPGRKTPPSLPAEEIFRRVSPSVVVVESLDAKGSVTVFGSGVVVKSLLSADIFDRVAAKQNGGKLIPSVRNVFVITNRHVTEDGVSYMVEQNGKKWPAKLTAVDPDHDLAELSVDGLYAPPFKRATRQHWLWVRRSMPLALRKAWS